MRRAKRAARVAAELQASEQRARLKFTTADELADLACQQVKR
jgi:hypothetical protein